MDLVFVDCFLFELFVSLNYFDEFVEGILVVGLMILVFNDGECRSVNNFIFILYDFGCFSCNVYFGCVFNVSMILVYELIWFFF